MWLRLLVLLLNSWIMLLGFVASIVVHGLGLGPQQMLRSLTLVIGWVDGALVESPLLVGVELHLHIHLLMVCSLATAWLDLLDCVVPVPGLTREGRLGVHGLLLVLLVKARGRQHRLYLQEMARCLQRGSLGPWLRLLGGSALLLKCQQVFVDLGAHRLSLLRNEVVHQGYLHRR